MATAGGSSVILLWLRVNLEILNLFNNALAEGHIKLTDFGVSAQLKSTLQDLQTQAGTPAFAAPEVLKDNTTYNCPADVWSFGITIYAMLHRKTPYATDGLSKKKVFSVIITSD